MTRGTLQEYPKLRRWGNGGYVSSGGMHDVPTGDVVVTGSTSSTPTDSEVMQYLGYATEKDDSQAFSALGLIFLHGTRGQRRNVQKAYELLTLSNDGGSSYETSGYEYVIQRTQTNGSFAEEKSTSSSSIRLTNTVSTGTGETGNLYCYMYNLGDNTKYSFFTYQTGYGISATFAFGLGSAVRTTAETINALRIQTTTADIITDCTVSLYGIKEYS